MAGVHQFAGHRGSSNPVKGGGKAGSSNCILMIAASTACCNESIRMSSWSITSLPGSLIPAAPSSG
ncbi:MAG: hypothetical protein WCA12_19070, partial [Burkholderiales bacterium]